MAGTRTRSPKTDTDRMARGLECLAEAEQHLMHIDLRRYRSKAEVRESLQETRQAVELGKTALHDALAMDAQAS